MWTLRLLTSAVVLRVACFPFVAGEELCAKGCKPLYIGDKNCDKECYNEECEWDGGDCKEEWEVRRTVVLGPFYKDVDHVEYHEVGPGGEKKQLTMQEGRRREGIDRKTREQRLNWKSLLEDDGAVDDDEDKTMEGRPPWYLNEEGVRIPAFRETADGVRIAIHKDGTDMYDEDGKVVYFVTGKAFESMKDDDEYYYYYDDDDDDQGSGHDEL